LTYNDFEKPCTGFSSISLKIIETVLSTVECADYSIGC